MKRLIVALYSAACAALAFGAVTNLTEDVRLTADADWRGQGALALGDGVTLDLDGHTLKTDGLVGEAVSLEDATIADPARVVSSSEVYSGDATFLFDNKMTYSAVATEKDDKTKNHRICATVMPFNVVYDFVEPTCIVAYRMYYNSLGSGGNRAPVDWTFEGSNDNATWRRLDTRTDQVEWYKPDVRTYRFRNTSRFRYYRLNVTKHGENTCLELYQLEYFKAPANRTDLTGPGGTVVSANTLASGHVDFLFDDNFTYTFDTSASGTTDTNRNHRICMTNVSGSNPFEVAYDFGSATNVNAYAISYRTLMGDSSRAPRDWAFAGSNDGETWSVLDRHMNDLDWKNAQRRFFALGGVSPYRQYRLSVSQPVSGNVLEMYQLEFFSQPQVMSSDKTNDVTVADASRVSSSVPAKLTGGDVAHLFDNEFAYRGASSSNQHRICSKLPFEVTYDMGAENDKAVGAYRIYYNASDSNRSPTSWTFDGSNDKTNWTVLDERTNTAAWAKGSVHDFRFAAQTPYRYYRLYVKTTGSAYLEMYQFEYFADNTGTLEVDIPSGVVVTNGTVNLGTAVKLVKDGGGTQLDATNDQLFERGLVVNAGTYLTPSDGPWFAGPVELNGGTLAVPIENQLQWDNALPSLKLGADSRLELGRVLTAGNAAGSFIDLDGHALTISMAKGGVFYLYAEVVTNGTVKVEGDADRMFYFNDVTDFSTVAFDFSCGYRMFNAPITAHDLTVRVNNPTATAKAMTVLGTFTPLAQGFQDTVMADGSTLNLASLGGTLSTASTTKGKSLSFASNANVTIDLWGRKPRRGDCLVSWTAAPDNVQFRIDAQSRDAGYDIETRADGIYFVNNHGLCIIFR